MTPMTHRVFVYGALKRGYSNYPMLATAREFFGDVATINTYRMLTMLHPAGMFPVILDDPNGQPVCGEIYHVDDETLARLDQLEREGSSYDRKLIDVTLPLASGERLPTKAFIYVGREDRFRKDARTRSSTIGSHRDR